MLQGCCFQTAGSLIPIRLRYLDTNTKSKRDNTNSLVLHITGVCNCSQQHTSEAVPGDVWPGTAQGEMEELSQGWGFGEWRRARCSEFSLRAHHDLCGCLISLYYLSPSVPQRCDFLLTLATQGWWISSGVTSDSIQLVKHYTHLKCKPSVSALAPGLRTLDRDTGRRGSKKWVL